MRDWSSDVCSSDLASILFFGDNSFAWRAASALFGSLLLILIYVLTRIICPEYHWAALLATGLAAIDGLSIAQSRIAMNDIFVTFFMTAGKGLRNVSGNRPGGRQNPDRKLSRDRRRGARDQESQGFFEAVPGENRKDMG